MGIEYVFFDNQFRDRFVQYVSSRGIACSVRQDGMEGLIAELPEDLDEALAEAVDAEYESLMQEQEIAAEAEEGWVTANVMGVSITLADGRPCVVRIPDEIVRRLSEHFSTDEIHSLVSAIAQSVENPFDGPICKLA